MPDPDRVHLCPDGKYRWIYEFSMLKNPIILITVLKIFFFIGLAMSVFQLFVGPSHWTFADHLAIAGKFMLLMMAIFVPLSILAYLIVAAQNHWKYIVFFEMDDRGVLHKQMKSQVKKAKAIGWLTVLAGMASGNVTTVGIGINSMAKTFSYSDFLSVKSVRPKRFWNTIKVNEPLSKNQVYVHQDDFDFVLDYILARCPKVKKKY